MITHTNDLNMTPDKDCLQINLSEKDADFSLVFNLVANRGALQIEENTTAKIHGTKGQGGSYEADATLETSGSNRPKVTVNGNTGITDEVGEGVFEIVLKHGGKELHSANFKIIIEKSPATE